jgi:ABC-type glycerol-3-phosphate transport system permease component
LAVQGIGGLMLRKLSIYLPLLVLTLITLIPFAYLVCSAFKTREAFFTSPFLPVGDGFLGVAWDQLTLVHLKRLWYQDLFLRNLVNSVFISSVTSVLSTLFAAMGGYALAKFRFFGREAITSSVLILLIVPGSLLFAPTYQLLYWFGMLNTYQGLIVPALAPAFGVYLFRQAMISSLPDEMLEAGRIDGCGEFKLFFSFALPMVRPMVGTFILITFLGTWNNYIGPQIIIKSPEMLPLSVAVAQLRSEYGQDYGMLMAGTLISIVPVMGLFLMLQREFIEGLSSGAVKG